MKNLWLILLVCLCFPAMAQNPVSVRTTNGIATGMTSTNQQSDTITAISSTLTLVGGTGENLILGSSGATLSGAPGGFTGPGQNLTALNASQLTSGTVPTARLGSGTANSGTFLRGDSTYAVPAAGTDGTSLTNLNINQTNVTGSPIPLIIWDDDFNPDIDMVPTMMMAYNAMNNAQCNLLAVTCSSSSFNGRSGVANAAVVAHYYNINTQFGSTTNTGALLPANDIFLTGAFPSGILGDVTSNSMNAVLLWRKVMATAPQHSIRLVVTGPGYNLDDFLKSPADSYSPQTGWQLMSNKVEMISVFGGDYTNGYEFNLYSSTNSVAWTTNYPISVPVYWAGFTLGNSVKTLGSTWVSQLATNNPAYLYATNKFAVTGRECWDQLSLAMAIWGTNYSGTNIFSLYQGTNTVTQTGALQGSNYWTFGTGVNFNQFYLSNACPVATLSNILNTLIVGGKSQASGQSFGFVTAKQISITDTNAGTGGNPLVIQNTSSSAFPFIVRVLAPNLPTAGDAYIQIGKSTSTGNAGYIGWDHSGGDGSALNGMRFVTEGGTGYFKFNGNGVSESQKGFSSLRSNLLAPTAITFPATTVNWTNTQTVNIVVYIDNTAVTGTAIKQNGTTIFSGLSADVTLMLQPNETFSETYTVGTPSATWKPF